MGKYKRLYENVSELTERIADCGAYILESWTPRKNCGLSKKEARAAYVGFALGLVNAANMVDEGEFHLVDFGPIRVYDWLCASVAAYRDSGDSLDEMLSMPDDIDRVTGEMLKTLLGYDDDDDESDMDDEDDGDDEDDEYDADEALQAFLNAFASAIGREE